jgi:hypothetical protein
MTGEPVSGRRVFRADQVHAMGWIAPTGFQAPSYTFGTSLLMRSVFEKFLIDTSETDLPYIGARLFFCELFLFQRLH